MKTIFIVIIAVIVVAGAAILVNQYLGERSVSEVGEEVSQPADETAGWETYRNTEYGYKVGGELLYYELNYPNDWIVKSGPGGVIFSDSEEEKCRLTAGGGAASRSTFEYSLIEDKEVVLDEKKRILSLLKNDYEAANDRYIVVSAATDKGLEFYGIIRLDDPKECFNIFQQIVSTFKFIRLADETADWKVYKNEKYGFEFDYAPDMEPISGSDSDIKSDQFGGLKFVNNSSENLSFSVRVIKGIDKFMIRHTTGSYVFDIENKVFRSVLVNNVGEIVIDYGDIGVSSSTQSDEDIYLLGVGTIAGATIYHLIPNYEKDFWVEFGVWIPSCDVHPSAVQACEVKGEASDQILKKTVSTFRFTQPAVGETADWEIYRNEKYGYSIRYPGSFTIFMDIDFQKEMVISPRADSDKISLTNNRANLFCCEPLITSISVVQEKIIDFKDWKKYAQIPDHRIKSQEEITFAGKRAYEVKASTGLDSAGARLIIVPGEQYSLIIIQGDEGETWDSITNSFRFTQ